MFWLERLFQLIVQTNEFIDKTTIRAFQRFFFHANSNNVLNVACIEKIWFEKFIFYLFTFTFITKL